jgi:hypothetical protein
MTPGMGGTLVGRLFPVSCKSERGHLCYISIASNVAGTFSLT